MYREKVPNKAVSGYGGLAWTILPFYSAHRVWLHPSEKLGFTGCAGTCWPHQAV